MHRLTAVALALVLAGPARAADRKFDPEARARTIAPYLDAEVVGLGHLDLSRVDVNSFVNTIGQIGKVPAKDVQAARTVLQSLRASLLGAGGKDVFLVASLADLSPVNKPMVGFMIVPLGEGADAEALTTLLRMAFPAAAQLPDGKAVFAGPKAALRRLRGLKPTPRPEVARAFAAAGDTAGQLLFLPTADNRRVLDEVLPRLPREIGGGPITTLTRGVQWAALGFDLSPKLSLRLTVQSKDAQAAQALKDWVAGVLKKVAAEKEVRETFPTIDRLVEALVPRVAGDRLTLALDQQRLTTVLEPALVKMRAAARRQVSQNNLRQIGIAFHMYYDMHKGFPTAASYDKQGKPLLSWRVHLLPFLEQEKLYKEFHLNEPWDSEHNKKLIARIPPVYRSDDANLTAAGKTRYLAPLGKATMFPGRKVLKISDVTDGTSNTIFVVEASGDRAVVWTRPEDWSFDPQKPMAGLVPKGAKGFLALFVDASVRWIPATIDPKTLAALFTRNGEEVVGDF